MINAVDSNVKPINMADELLEPALSRGQENDCAIISNDEKVTYGELNLIANRAGNVFKNLGVKAGDRILMLVRDTPNFFYIYLGLLKIGAVPIGLNTRLAPKDLAYIIDDSKSEYFVLDQCYSGLFEKSVYLAKSKPIPIFTDVVVDGHLYFQSLLSDASDVLQTIELQQDSPAIWMYSSGTTGKPKGVIHLQKTVTASADLMGKVLGVGPGDRIYSTSKLFFAFSLAHCFMASLRLGATAILDPNWPDPSIVSSIVERHRPTVMLSVPTFYRSLLRKNFATKQRFKNVRYYLTAGEKMPTSLFNNWMEATGRSALEGIGATETCFLFLANRPGNFKPGTCGIPTPGTEVKLVDQDGKNIKDSGVPGVLWVKMNSLAFGYQNMQEQSEKVFKQGWYCTNDMFKIDEEGMYEHQGRADDMLKISGQWVSPTEIEETVCLHAKVSEAGVVGVPDNDGLVRLALFIVAPNVGNDREIFEKELTALILTKLSIYKCPRAIYYLDAMPLTPTGKLKRFALRELVTEGDLVA